jgi:CBS domain-containing protein
MKVQEVMSKNVACCGSDTSLQDVAGMMVDADCGEIPVADGRGLLLGVITDRDIVVRTIARGRNPLEMVAAECMTTPAVTVTPETSIKECCDVLERNQIRRVPVVDLSNRCIGIVSLADIARHASGRATAEVVQEVSKPSPRPSATPL